MCKKYILGTHYLWGHLNILGKLSMKEILNGVWQNRFEQLLGVNWKDKKKWGNHIQPAAWNKHGGGVKTEKIQYTKGAFHSTQNFGNFGWLIKWNGPFRFGLIGMFVTSFEGGPLWPVRLSRSVRPKCLILFDKIFVPSIALLYPAYKNNNQTRGTIPLGSWNFWNFKPEFLLNGKSPRTHPGKWFSI